MLTTADFARRLADEKGYTYKDANIIVRDVIDLIKEIMLEGGGVKFSGFGNFYVKSYKDRSYTTKHGEEVYMDSFDKPKFSAGKLFSGAIREQSLRR